MRRILVVDDEQAIREGIREFAEFEGYQVHEAKSGTEAIDKCMKEDFDVIIMDVMMPKIDGFSAYKEIRKSKDIPVIMLSARGEEYDKLYGFELGIDDYVVKPFSLKELMARVNVVISRRNANEGKDSPRGETFKFDGLEVNISGREVSIYGKRQVMTPKEYDLLFYLVQNPDIVLSREELLNKVWGYDYYGDDRTVDSHIKMLRRSLGEYRKFIVTYRGAGYKFEPD